MRLVLVLLVVVWCPTVPVTKQSLKPRATNPQPKTSPPQRSLELAPNQAQTGPVSPGRRPVTFLVDVPCLESVPKAKPKPKDQDRHPGEDQEDGPGENQEYRAKERANQERWEVARDSHNPADEQEYSYYSTEEEGLQAKAKVQLVPNPAFLEHLRAGAAARRQGQEKGQAAAPQGPAGELSSDSSTADAEDDMPVSPVPKLGEDQDMEATKDDEATHQVQKPESKEEDTSAKEATGQKEQATSLELVE
ncbi:unnamed protein product, partial [Symbiodinium microadriaticum]